MGLWVETENREVVLVFSQATQQKFPFSYEAVFDGLVKVIPSAGMSLFSWGENLTLVVEKIDENSTIIGIESALKFGGSLAGSHRHQKNFDKIIAALSQNLQRHSI